MAALFPSTGHQILSLLTYFFGLSILSHCLSRRIRIDGCNRDWLRDIAWSRVFSLLVFIFSWLFVFSTGLLTFGIGLETTPRACTAAILLCGIFYVLSKGFTYLFLVEKVHIVWSSMSETKRLRSPVYLACLISVAIYNGIVINGILGIIHYWRPGDGACVIGLDPKSAIPMLAFDIYITIFLNVLFLWPLFKWKFVTNSNVRLITIRTLVGSTVALTTSAVNVLVMKLLGSKELGWVCLVSCNADVIINALAVFWVTAGPGSYSSSSNQAACPSPSKDPEHFPTFTSHLSYGTCSNFSTAAATISHPGCSACKNPHLHMRSCSNQCLSSHNKSKADSADVDWTQQDLPCAIRMQRPSLVYDPRQERLSGLPLSFEMKHRRPE